MSEFYDEYTDDELTEVFENKLHISEEVTMKVSSIIEKATKNVSDIMKEERKNIILKNTNNEVKKNFKQKIEGKSIKETSIETEKTCVLSNITKL